MFAANGRQGSTQEIISCVIVFTPAMLPWKSKYHQNLRKDVHFRNWYTTCKLGVLL